jgi:sterol desaturase/sphingolipid hydroxylase (fatty acid hydroxylase superfamily)
MELVIDIAAFLVRHIQTYVATEKGIADIATFAGVLVFCLVIEYARIRSARRYGWKGFRTDLLYSAVYLSGAYSLFVGLPIYRFLTGVFSAHVPFLQTHALEGLPVAVQLVVALAVSDLTYYTWHRTVHATPILWAFHSIHHSQQQLTIATSLRVHLFEEMVRGLFYFVPFFILGLPAHVWLPFDILMNWLLFLEHSDLDWTYGRVGRLVVSPHFHRIHHSSDRRDFDKNFGSFFSIWDRLFGTFSARDTRPEAYGVPAMAVPESFVRQFFFPFFWLARRWRSGTDPTTAPVAVVATSAATPTE